MSDISIPITEPVTIRGYRIGGIGGSAASSTELHRLVLRTRLADVPACNTSFGSMKTSIQFGRPKKAAAAKYGVCRKCWPEEQA